MVDIHLHLYPVVGLIVATVVPFASNLCKETIVRLVAYIGADYALLSLGKRESMHQHREAIDRFLDD